MQQKKNKHGKYYLNENYFDSIDTPNKAYFLGFLFADGCNTGYSIKIQVSEIDKDILYKLKKEINSNCKLLPTNEHLFTYNKKNYISKKCYILWLNNKYLCNRLSKIGCIPRKTFLLKFPNTNYLPNKYISHFIRGYFDGDGSLSYETYKKGCKFFFIGRKNFCLKVKDVLESKLNIKLSFNKFNGHRYWTLYSSSIPNVKKILDFLYKNSSIHLNRKYKKYTDFLKFKYEPFIVYNNRFANNIYKEKTYAQ